MNTLEIRNSYSEVFELLKYVDRNDLNKIPMNLLETIKENRNEEYVPDIDLNDINNSLSKKARSIYMWLYLTYIIDNREEKEKINKTLYQNEIKERSNLSFNENIFKKKPEYEPNKENNQLVVNKLNILKRIINRIRYFLKSRGK